MVYTNPIVRSDADELFPEDPVAVIEAESADILLRGYERIPQEPEYDSNDSPNEVFIGNDPNYCPLRDDDRNLDPFYYYIKHPQPPEPKDTTYEIPSRLKPIFSNEKAGSAKGGPSGSKIDMDDEKVAEVKKIMVNINLPPSCVPEWASDVPEDEWKDFIMKKLHLKKSESYCEDVIEE